MVDANLLQVESMMTEASKRWRSFSTVSVEMKGIVGMIPEVDDMERRLGIMQNLEFKLDSAINTLTQATNVKAMLRKECHGAVVPNGIIVDIWQKMVAITKKTNEVIDMERRAETLQYVEPLLVKAIGEVSKVGNTSAMEVGSRRLEEAETVM